VDVNKEVNEQSAIIFDRQPELSPQLRRNSYSAWGGTSAVCIN